MFIDCWRDDSNIGSGLMQRDSNVQGWAYIAGVILTFFQFLISSFTETTNKTTQKKPRPNVYRLLAQWLKHRLRIDAKCFQRSLQDSFHRRPYYGLHGGKPPAYISGGGADTVASKSPGDGHNTGMPEGVPGVRRKHTVRICHWQHGLALGVMNAFCAFSHLHVNIQIPIWRGLATLRASCGRMIMSGWCPHLELW